MGSMPFLWRQVRDFHIPATYCASMKTIEVQRVMSGNPRPSRLLMKSDGGDCTDSGQWPVHSVHSIGNMTTYKGMFFVD